MEVIEIPRLLSSHPRFLSRGASITEQIQAAARNHIEWFSANTVAKGGVVQREKGVVYTGAADGAVGGGDIAFPRLNPATAGETLDRILAFYRERHGEDGSGGSVGVWATTPIHPRDLGARLLARGFEVGWKPHWMAADLHDLNTDLSLPDGLHISVEEDSTDWQLNDLPYWSPDDAARLKLLAANRPRRTWHFAARLDGKPVGQSVLLLTTGRYGVGGIYNVGVLPSVRRQGIGSAVTLAACQFARGLGANYALLNAANPFYERIGFRSLGYGQTWWIHDRMFAQPPPTPEQIAFVEALGRGDVDALNALPPAALPADFYAPLLCGYTPVEIAALTRQPRSARWLAGQGVIFSVVDAWNVGWKRHARAMVATNPAAVNQLSVQGVRTPLHEAILRNDMDLLRLLLTASPDFTVLDKEYNGTALGWAEHFRNKEAARLIREAMPPTS